MFSMHLTPAERQDLFDRLPPGAHTLLAFAEYIDVRRGAAPRAASGTPVLPPTGPNRRAGTSTN